MIELRSFTEEGVAYAIGEISGRTKTDIALNNRRLAILFGYYKDPGMRNGSVLSLWCDEDQMEG